MSKSTLITCAAACFGALLSSGLIALVSDGEAQREADSYVSSMIDAHYQQSQRQSALTALHVAAPNTGALGQAHIP